MSVGNINNNVCLLSFPPTSCFKTLKYDTSHLNKNTISFEIQILTKIRRSEIQICYFNIRFWNYCIKILESLTEMELMTVSKKKNFTERSVRICFGKHCTVVKGLSIYTVLQKNQRKVFQSSVPEYSSWHHLKHVVHLIQF